MACKIEILNPHLKSPKELIDIANMLMRMAGAQMVKAPTAIIKSNVPGITNTMTYGDRELDASGTEWNPEIHSAKRTQTTDGLWRARRNSLNGEEIEEDEDPPSDFQKFMSYIVEHSKELPPDYLTGVLRGFGLENVVQVQECPEHIVNIMTLLRSRVEIENYRN